MRAVIFANGELADTEAARAALRPDDLLIAADGGANHCRALHLTPDVVIGDFDSLSDDDLAALEADGATLIRHPARKDETDLELALLYAKEQRADEILVLAALGARWDQTLANLLLPAHPRLRNLDISFQQGKQRIYPISGQRTVYGHPGDTLSLLPIGGDAIGVTTNGLEYPLSDETLTLGQTRGVSNLMLAEEATISLRDGLLLCIVIRET